MEFVNLTKNTIKLGSKILEPMDLEDFGEVIMTTRKISSDQYMCGVECVKLIHHTMLPSRIDRLGKYFIVDPRLYSWDANSKQVFTYEQDNTSINDKNQLVIERLVQTANLI